MRNKRTVKFAALFMVLALTAAACGGGGDGDEPAQNNNEDIGQGEKGGVYRIGYLESFGFTGGFDPTGEYLGSAFTIYSNLLLRTLMGYRHTADEGGNEPIPDLAEGPPEVNEDATQYTYTLKEGVKFGPPVSREITSQDVVYAFERIGTESLVAQYGFYYDIIEGMAEFKEGKAKTISGIETPDDKTIIFNLTQPTGDFDYRVAMPAAAPVPPEIGKCFNKAGDYGRYVVASGPYMIEGSDQQGTSCKDLEPLSGYAPDKFMNLVRNPDYDPATDTEEAREALPDRFEFIINTNQKDIFDKIEAGEYEDEIASPLPQTLRKYSQDPELEDRLKINSGDRTWYISMNLTQPPFDDVHVRKAVNLIMDKEGMRRAWGGPLRGEIAHHIVPDAMLNDILADYAPYGTEGDAGDLEAAKEEMKQSKYDTDGDGLCDAPACKGVLHYTRNYEPWTDMLPIQEAAFAKIGIEVQTKELADFYTPFQDVSKAVPVGSGAGWGKDYSDPSTFMVLFDSASILATGNVNYSLVGLTPDLAKELDVADQLLEGGTLTGIPSVDQDIEECNPLLEDERLECWANLDRKLMEDVVPWVPYLDATNIHIISENVTQWDFDQFSGYTAYAHVAVDADAQQL